MDLVKQSDVSTSQDEETEFAIDLRHGLGLIARHRMACGDVAKGFGLWRLALTLSWLDIRLRYRGSILGPFWLTLSTALMIGSLGFLYAFLFHTPIRDYLPFLSLSLILWTFIATIISEGCTVFVSAEGMIRSMRIPFSVYLGQLLARNILILGHNVVVIVVVFLAFQVPVSFAAFAAIPAFLIWMVDGIATALLLGAICARFRDIPPIIGSIMQIAFYVSAVMFKPEFLGKRGWFLLYDPFFTLLQIVRQPLLGSIPGYATYLSAIGFSIALCALTWYTFLRVRHRIAFWI
ncbi:ABC transporter permease [Acidisoma silvae]|uniref:ABC transporter permease n=1 Tax=Acidisoma silvae TaxID=2802396 RepID=A0A963YWE6_9PROT|nr:ABC transporter permease [Acidisoma silvae]MCB8878374.1 ABC transporter permease [Acidisoma silvae]